MTPHLMECVPVAPETWVWVWFASTPNPSLGRAEEFCWRQGSVAPGHTPAQKEDYDCRILAYEPVAIPRAVEGRPPSMSMALLSKAGDIQRDRAGTYDKPDGERSMASTVAAFNAITGRDLRESEGWMLLTLLKLVRSETAPAAHLDSLVDGVSYHALYGEAKLGGL